MAQRNPTGFQNLSGLLVTFSEFNLGAIPAIRYNLLLFKGKSKRISTSIGARAGVSRRK